MHLLNGHPAEFCAKDERVAYAGARVTRLAESLRQIRREQQASKRFYRDDSDRYDYVRIARTS
jgi:hypothetical protein